MAESFRCDNCLQYCIGKSQELFSRIHKNRTIQISFVKDQNYEQLCKRCKIEILSDAFCVNFTENQILHTECKKCNFLGFIKDINNYICLGCNDIVDKI